MTFEEAQAELIRHRNLALTRHGNDLLSRGLSVDGEEFRRSMLNYASDLEEWRWRALLRISESVGKSAPFGPVITVRQ